MCQGNCQAGITAESKVQHLASRYEQLASRYEQLISSTAKVASELSRYSGIVRAVERDQNRLLERVQKLEQRNEASDTKNVTDYRCKAVALFGIVNVATGVAGPVRCELNADHGVQYHRNGARHWTN